MAGSPGRGPPRKGHVLFFAPNSGFPGFPVDLLTPRFQGIGKFLLDLIGETAHGGLFVLGKILHAAKDRGQPSLSSQIPGMQLFKVGFAGHLIQVLVRLFLQ